MKCIESLKVTAGKRIYFVDVNETIEGRKYLNICERKRLRNGEYEGHRIIIFEEGINSFAGALQKALKYFPSGDCLGGKSRMARTKDNYENAYKPWTEEEDNKLTELFRQSKRTQEISEILQRNNGAINSRIKKLKLTH